MVAASLQRFLTSKEFNVTRLARCLNNIAGTSVAEYLGHCCHISGSNIRMKQLTTFRSMAGWYHWNGTQPEPVPTQVRDNVHYLRSRQ